MTYAPDIEALLGCTSPLDRPLVFTLLARANRPQGRETTQTLRRLRNAILRKNVSAETVEAAKEKMPLFLGGSFLGAYRSAARLMTVEMAHGDYDAGRLPMAEAATLTRSVGIACMLYTSPRHTPRRPRWRILAPFSKALPARRHADMVARLNGVLGGVLAGESFSAGQGYFYGCVNGARPKIIFVDGDAIDARDDLDAGAIRPRTAWRESTPAPGDDRPKPKRMPLERVHVILEGLDKRAWRDSYRGWLTVGMALHHQFQGKARGVEEWTEFSEGSPHFDVEEIEYRWATFGRHSEPVTMGTLIRAVVDTWSDEQQIRYWCATLKEREHFL